MPLTHTAGYPDMYSSPEIGPLFGPQLQEEIVEIRGGSE